MAAWPNATSLAVVATGWLPVLVDVALKGMVILAVAGAATMVARRASAATRHLIWFSSLASLLALPILSAALPGWKVLPHWAGLDAMTSGVQQASSATTADPAKQKEGDRRMVESLKRQR
jgi:hypothetical protein